MSTMSFSVECENLYGLAVFHAYIGNPTPNIPIEQSVEIFKMCQQVLCCFDTGANTTSISTRLLKKIHLPKFNSSVKIVSINATAYSDQYLAGICFPNNFVIASVPVSVVEFGDNPIDLNVGMDIIALGNFSLEKKNGKMILHFEV